MDDADLVRRGERVGDHRTDASDLRGIAPSVVESSGERPTPHVFEDLVDAPVPAQVEREAPDDRRMRDGRRGSRFAQEALEQLRGRRRARVHHLHRDELLGREILSEEDGAHSAVSELAHDPDATIELDAGRERRIAAGGHREPLEHSGELA